MVVEMPMQALLKALWKRPQKQALLGSRFNHLLHTLLAVTACFFLNCACSAAHAGEREFKNDPTRQIFDWRDPATSTGAPPNLSLYRPPAADYGAWGEMSRDDRKVALAQIVAGIVGYNLNASKVGKAILALREPIQGSGKSNLHCSQRFTTTRYFLRCGLKF